MLFLCIKFSGDYMTLKDVIKIVNGKASINDDYEIKGIKTDSRKINKGDLFIALKGKNYNGNDFVIDALEKGAVACITSESINDRCIVVNDTNESLFYLGNYIRNSFDIPLIAITGSNGKTTTKDLIAHILSSKYEVLKNEVSHNNLIGVSDTLFKLNKNYEIIVMELGSNHMGEISYLSRMCNPSKGIITNIGSSHLEYFKTRKNIFKEKYSIKDGMSNRDIIVNGDDKYLKKLKCYKCGINSNNDLIAYNIYEDLEYISFCIYLDREYRIVFNNPGIHFIDDILLAIKVCLDYGVKIKTIIKKIKSFKLNDKRMHVIKLNDNILLNDCYNASYESIRAGIDYLKKVNLKKVLIIGDVLELGKHSKKIHKKINKKIKELDNYNVLTVGTYSKYIDGTNFNSIDELIDYLKCNNISNSYIYIKGSRKMNLDKVVEYLKEE